jgi:hypothetical protein
VEQWRQELSGMNQFLVNQVGIPSDQIAGFRSPDLQTNEPMWSVLKEYNFMYDASLTEFVRVPPLVSTGPDSFAWPQTLDHGSGLACLTNHCPDAPLPGVWSIPLWMWYDSAAHVYGAMDPSTASDSVFGALLDFNFHKRFSGNRCPLGIFMHAGQLGLPGRREVLRNFLVERLKQPEVWMITMRGLIEWMRDPVPVSALSDWFRQGRHRGVGRIAAAPPAPPVLLAPDNNASLSSTNALLNWDVLLTASSYQLQVSTTPDFSVNRLDTLFLVASTFNLQSLPVSSPCFWRVRGINSAGPGGWSEARKFVTTAATAVADQPLPAGGFRLEQSFPNPFNPTTTISFTLPSSMHTTVRIFNAIGMEIATLVNADLQQGQHSIVWNAASYASGPYFCQLQAGSFRDMKRMLLLR